MTGAPHPIAAGLTSILFVPGSRPDRFAKALASDADQVVIDLEDAVPADGKTQARADAIAAIGDRIAIRINPLTTPTGLADLLALAAAPAPPALIFVPKVESRGEIAVLRGALGDFAGIVPLIETPLGLRHAPAIAAAPGVAAVMFGGGDVAAELGVALAWDPLLYARQALLVACAEAGAPAIDVPWIALDDADGLVDECARAHAIGFQAKAAIHPAQLGAIHAAFRPSADLLAEARDALAAHAAAGGGAIRYNGRMLEAPIVRRYQRIIAMGKDSGNA
ncbi:MAG: HpcH/HpaI aldolase/citrate lyase family protein [Proteobacteria bacterium]|nr:HpcH/HpaI aldolase/citrate lyase family protein [Pseudomonadota bacterium]